MEDSEAKETPAIFQSRRGQDLCALDPVPQLAGRVLLVQSRASDVQAWA